MKVDLWFGRSVAGFVQKGQIATQYIDTDGNVAHGMPFNPNQSLFGIEGITSESGKIFGRMGHPERFVRWFVQKHSYRKLS